MTKAFHSSSSPQFPTLAGKTYAAHPVWRDSTTKEVKFAPLSKKAAVKIYHDARRFERSTRGRWRNGRGIVSRQDGAIGRAGLCVLHAFLFDFLNHRTGRLDPSWDALAHAANVSRATVHRALVKLRAAGIVSWARRCAGRMIDGRFILEQETNAYGVAPATQWRGYRPMPEAPAPDPEGWGAAPPMPALGLQAGDSRARTAVVLEGNPSPLAGALARLARRI